GGERITLALVRQPALNGQPQGSIFVNPGGHGSPGASYIKNSIDGAVSEELQEQFDLIGWDPRATGEPSAVQSLDPEAMDEYLDGLDETALQPGSDEWIAAASTESAAFGAACLEATGPLLGFVDTMSTVQ